MQLLQSEYRSAKLVPLAHQPIFPLLRSDFIYPLFVHEKSYNEEISSMPDCFRFSLTGLVEEVEESLRYY